MPSEKNLEDCKKIVFRMNDRNQSIKVRIKAATLLGFVAKYNSLGSGAVFEEFFLSDKPSRVKLINQVCQDLHWEVRKEMCSNLIHVSKCIGDQKAMQYILPELKELMDDEEGEVVSEAIIQYQKHLTKVFDSTFC